MSAPEKRRVAYFPGCMSVDCARELDMSLRAALAALDVEAVELAGWNCCGGDVVDSVTPAAAAPLARRILDEAASLNDELVCACPVCPTRLGGAEGRVKVRTALELLSEPHMLSLIEQRRKEKLEGLKVACFYGPARVVTGDDAPESRPMEDVMRTCGLTVVSWPGRRRPHGGYSAFAAPSLMRAIAGRVLVEAIESGADLIVLEDPHAQLNLDLFQYTIGRELRRAVDIPVLFVSELVAHTLGLEVVDRCYSRHATPPFRVFLDHYDRQFAVVPKERRDAKRV